MAAGAAEQEQRLEARPPAGINKPCGAALPADPNRCERAFVGNTIGQVGQRPPGTPCAVIQSCRCHCQKLLRHLLQLRESARPALWLVDWKLYPGISCHATPCPALLLAL